MRVSRVEHGKAHHIGFEVVEQVLELVLRQLAGLLADIFRRRLLLYRCERIAAHVLFRNLEGGGELGAILRLERVEEGLVLIDGNIARLLRGALGQANDGLDRRLHVAMAEHHSPEHRLLGKLLRFGLHHQHGVRRAGDDEVELRRRHLVDLRVQHILVVDVAHARGADRAHEGNARNGERGGGCNQRYDVGIVLHVVAQHRDDDLGLVAVAFGEKRTDRTIDQAGDQRLALGGASFAFEVTARNFAGGEILLLIIDGQRKEIDSGARGSVSHDGREHHGLAIGCDDGAIGLAGDLARLKHEFASAPFEFFAYDIEHRLSSFFVSPLGRIAKGCCGLVASMRETAASQDLPKSGVARGFAFIANPCECFLQKRAERRLSVSDPAARSASRNASRPRP